ncbi:MAG: hypothetical protein NTW80_05035 [Deltaproteobacteria bacterium]|nr:hypothetical protein [Deltaproteobacteria bacterium]
MVNILLTSDCNHSSSHRLAGNERSELTDDQLLSWENLIYLADFLWASGQRQVSLSGGEPTRHPQCVDFILYLLDRGFAVTVCTDGILTPARLEEFACHLTQAPSQRLNLVCHLHDPVQTLASPAETQRLHSFLAVMGPWTQAGFEIQRLDFTLEFLFDYLTSFGLQRHLRLGLAHPIPGSKSGFIQAKDMRRVVRRLYAYRHLFESQRVRPRLDCGFPLCKFSDAELGWLHRHGDRATCGSGPAFQISPDMNVYHCFPLANYPGKSLFEFDSLEQIDTYFMELRDEIKAGIAGVYAACSGCQCRDNEVCDGGGLSRIGARGSEAAPLGLAGSEDGISQDRLPG